MSPDTGRHWYVVPSITGRISDNVPALIELLPALGIILVGIAIIAGGELLQSLMDIERNQRALMVPLQLVRVSLRTVVPTAQLFWQQEHRGDYYGVRTEL